MTDAEKRILRVNVRTMAGIRERKAAARRRVDPKGDEAPRVYRCFHCSNLIPPADVVSAKTCPRCGEPIYFRAVN